MASSLFSLTASDLQKKMFPAVSSGSATQFSIGDHANDDLSTSDAEAILNLMELRLQSMFARSRYKVLLEQIDGEVLTRYAPENTTVLTTGLAPVTNLKVYVNFPSGRGWWTRNADDETETSDANYPHSVALDTGTITFDSALPIGARVYATYSHSKASEIQVLRHAVLNLSAAEVARRFGFFESEAQFERFSQWDASALAMLRDIAEGRAGVDVIDDLDLLHRDTNRKPLEAVARL